MEKTTWKKEPAIEGKHNVCNGLGKRPSFFPPDGLVISIGSWYTGLHKDGKPVWTDNSAINGDDYLTGAQAEKLALADPDHDWRIVMLGQLSWRIYQRHGVGKWVLIDQD